MSSEFFCELGKLSLSNCQYYQRGNEFYFLFFELGKLLLFLKAKKLYFLIFSVVFHFYFKLFNLDNSVVSKPLSFFKKFYEYFPIVF